MLYVYGIFFNDPEPQCCYVGVTDRSIEQRWKEHQKGIQDASNDKELYFFIRNRGLQDKAYIEQIEAIPDGGATGTWEDFWVKEFIKLGHPIRNAISGNKKVAKKREKKVDRLLQAEQSSVRHRIKEEWRDATGNSIEAPRVSKADKLVQKTRPPMLYDLENEDWKPWDGKWESMKWDKIVLKRIAHTKKKRQIKVTNNDTRREMNLWDKDCDDFLKLYMKIVEKWQDTGWGERGNLWGNLM